jgi:hypothetical protein
LAIRIAHVPRLTPKYSADDSVPIGLLSDYSGFSVPIEVQSLGIALPNLQARRTTLPHSVYEILN